MAGFPLGVLALVAAALLVVFGLGHRVLDRMYLTDKAALIFIGSMIVGSFIDIPLTRGQVNTSINVGGGILPISLAVYILSRAGTTKEWLRALGAMVATALAIFAINTYVFSGDPWQTGTDVIDPLYLYPLVAGGLAYLLGRSRRGAFVAATLGVLLLDVYDFFYLRVRGIPGTVAIGGAGAFDVIVLSGLIAVLLAELVGETRERLQGGPESEGRPPELIKGLKEPVLKPEVDLKDQDHEEQGGEEDAK